MAVKVTCIKKDNGFHENPHLTISHFGWINEETNITGSSNRIQIYDFIKTGGIAYIKDAKGNILNLITAETEDGTKYVKSTPNDTPLDNLLNLKECS